jgi:subtilisin family serine protease
MKKRSTYRQIASRRFQVETLEARLLLSSTPDGTLAVQLAVSASVSGFSEIAAGAGASVQATSVPGLFEVQGSGSSLTAVSAAVVDNPDVLYTAPVQTEQATLLPNDPEFQNGNLYGLNGTYGINAPAAWNVTTGSPTTVTIADLDTGADYNHPDLYQNIWINQAEIPTSRMVNLVDVYHDGYISWRDLNNPVNIGPGKITDVNGDGVIDAGDILSPMILNSKGQDTGAGGWANPANTQDGDTAHPDDLIGWNFMSNNNNPLDDNGHGTHTAGIIAAMGNNGVGVVGVNWSAQVMLVKMLDGSGSGSDVEAAAAIQYAANHGARVANASWGGQGTDTLVANAIASAATKNMVFVAAAGNSATNTDSSPFWPASAGEPNEISVGASQSNGTRAGFSNYGAKTVSLFAPGVNVESTWLNHQYAYESGTSMAAPYVTGTVALVAGLHPTWSYSQLVNQIETTATAYSWLAGSSVTGGILNAGVAVAPVYPASATFLTTDMTTQGNWKTAYGGDGFDVSQDPSSNNPTVPSYATLNLTGALSFTCTAATSDPRAAQVSAPGSTSRIAAAWYSPYTLSFNLSLSDGQSHLLALYLLDWDNSGGGRSERINLINNATGATLDSRTVSSFQDGEYLVWNVSGSLTIRVTNLNSSSNAVVSGLFLGGPAGPAVVAAASAGSNPVSGTSTTLSVLGTDAQYPGSALTYTWVATTVPTGAAAPTFSVNGTNAAQQTTVQFSQAGTYAFQVTITDPAKMSITSNVTITVAQTLTAITVTPPGAMVLAGGTQPFTATANDQFGQTLSTRPALLWSVDAGGVGGTVAATGLYTAPAAGTGTDTVRVSSGSVSGTATVSVVAAATGLLDGGFEAPSVGTSSYASFAYAPAGTPWSFTAGGGVAGNGSGFTAGNPNAPEGTQVGFLQGIGSFSQVISGMTAGTYLLTFDAAQRANWQASRQDFQVLVDGVAVGTFIPVSASYAQYTTSVFTVAAGSHTIAFQGLDTAGGDNTAFIDAVQLTQAPPPATGLLDGGFEALSVGTGSYASFAYAPAGTSWSFTTGGGVAGNGSGFTAGNPNAPEGTQVGFLQGIGSFSQVISGMTAGTYLLTFDAAQRANWQASQQDFQVLVDGSVVGTFTPSGISYATYTTAAFTVAAGSHTITFQGLDTAGGDNTAFVDDVGLTQATSSSPSAVLSGAGFEAPSVGTGSFGSFQYDPTGTPWSYSGSAGVAGNGSGFTSGNPNAPEGTQVGFLQRAGSFSQVISGMAAGTYLLTFDAAQRANWQASRQDFQVLVDGVAVGTFIPASTSSAQYTTSVFTVAAGSHTIAFQGLDTAGGDNTAFVDTVRLVPVAS